MRWEKFVWTMLLLLAIYIGLISLTINGWGYLYKEKNATITIYKGEMGWCVFGNPEHANPICNTLELKNNPALIDQFLQFLEYGMVLEDDDD